jgi:hypothetical protein
MDRILNRDRSNKRHLDDLVSRVTFKGRKTGKTLVRWSTTRTTDIGLAEGFALKNWQLADDLDRLISLETKTREEWLRDGVDVGRAGTMIGT